MSKTKPPGTNKPNELTRLFAEFAGNAPDTALVIHQPFLKLCKGDHLAALLLSQIIYWQGKTTDPDGWFSHSYEEWHTELYLSQYQVSRLVRGETNEKRKRKSDVFTLQSVGVETKRRRSRYHKGAATIHYRVNWHTLGLALKECFTEDEASPVVNIVDNESMTNINIVDNDDVNIVDNNVVNNASNVYIDYPETIAKTSDANASSAPVPPKPKKPKVSVKPKASDTTPRSKLDKRDALYEDVERIIFEIVATDDDPYNFRGLCGNITKWLRGEIRKFKDEVLPASPVVEITPSHLEEFVRRYRKTNGDTSIPTYPPKFANHWSRLMSHTRTVAQASQNGVYHDELDRALKTVAHPRTGQPLTSAQRSIARDLVTARHYDADAQLEALESILMEHVP